MRLLFCSLIIFIGCTAISPTAPTPASSPPEPPTASAPSPTGAAPTPMLPGGFVCGPERCVFAPGYRWETQEAYCLDHPKETLCDS